MHCSKAGKNHPELSARKERRMIPILRSGIMVYIISYQTNLTAFWFGFAAWNSEIVPSNDLPLEAIPTDPNHQAKPLGDFEWCLSPISESWNGRIWTGFVRTLHLPLDMSWSLSSDLSNVLVHFMFWSQILFVSSVRCFYMQFFCISHALRITDVLAKMAIASKLWEISLA